MRALTRQRGLIATGIATLVLLLAMSPADERMQDTGGPGIVPFELTGGQERADEILAEWGEKGQDAARESLWIDFGFLLAYGAFLTLALASVRDRARERGWRRLAAIGGVVVSFGALGAAFDALENTCLLLTLDDAGAAFPLLATIFAACKFALLAAAVAYLIAGLATLLLRRGDPATGTP
jgi:nitrate/nitrite transporter NarK